MKVLHVARKPLAETSVALNCKKNGTGALNISATRVSTSDSLNGGAYAKDGKERWDGAENWRYKREGGAGEFVQPSGRWPSNLILQHLPECQCVGTKRVKGSPSSKSFHDAYEGEGSTKFLRGHSHPGNQHADADGKETVAAWECEPGCPVVELDERSGQCGGWYGADTTQQGRAGARTLFGNAQAGGDRVGYNDTGGASRFFKQVGGKTDDG